MSDQKIIVQIGGQDWSQIYKISEKLSWTFLKLDEIDTYIELTEEKISKKNAELTSIQKPIRHKIDALIIDGSFDSNQILKLSKYVPFYQTFCLDEYSSQTAPLKKMMIQFYDGHNKVHFVQKLHNILFPGQSGGKFFPNDIDIFNSFTGEVRSEGVAYHTLLGDFGQEFTAIGTYRSSIWVTEFCQDIWPEFIKDESVELYYEFYLTSLSARTEIIKTWRMEKNNWDQPIVLTNDVSGYVSCVIYAKGSGQLKLGPLHVRLSRQGYGQFVLGGETHSDVSRQEFQSFLYPADFKPPLNVYFSGWRSAEGFEGFSMMRDLGAPFLLICDPRLEGGSFYLGSEKFEASISQVIQEALDFLGFTRKDLILSGLSMGTFGAFYYGCEFNPKAIIVSKPLVNLGEVARNEKLNRPGIFPVSLSVSHYIYGGVSEEDFKALDQRFWKKFKSHSFKGTEFAITHMIEDDYEHLTYSQMIDYFFDQDVKVYSKGFHGRHNEGLTETITWFKKQYKTILEQEFGRGPK